MADEIQIPGGLETLQESQFKDAVLTGAREKAASILSRAEQRAKYELEAAREACETADPGTLAAGYLAENEKHMGNMQVEARRDLLHYREELARTLFAGVQADVEEFVQGEEYPAWLTQRLQAYSAQCTETGGTVLLREEDIPLAKQLSATLPGCEFAADATIQLGGFKLRAGARLFDETLDTRFENEKQRFYSGGALRLG